MDSQPDRRRDLTASSAPAVAAPAPPPPTPTPTPPHPPRAARMGACMGRCIADKSSCLKRWRSTDENETELMTDDEEDSTQRRKKKERKLIFRIIKFKRKDRKQFLEKFLERQDLNYSRLSSVPAAELTDIQLQSLDAQTLLVTAGKDVTTTNCFAPAVSSRTSSSLDLEWEHEYGQHNQHHNRALSRSWLFIDGAAAEAAEEYEDDNKPLFNSPPSEEDGSLQSKQQQQRFVNGQASTSSSSSLAAKAAAAAAANGQQLPNFTRTSSRTSWSHISTPESLEWDIDEEQRNQMHLEDDNLDHETLELLHQIEMLKNKVLNETGDGLEAIDFGRNATGRSADS